MRNKIINYLQEETRTINVRSKEEWIELMEYLDFYDFRWSDNNKATDFIDFKKYQEESSISLGFEGDERLQYSPYSYYCENKKYTTVLFQNFKKEFIEKDLAYQLHLAKKRVDELEQQLKEETIKYYARFKLKENNLNYLKFDKQGKDFNIASNWENQIYKSKFTQKELEDLQVWDNPVFEIEEVKE